MSNISLGLERVTKLLSNIPYTRPNIHVAGTNGKGSVSTLIESTLRESGLRVGKFTSPHLVYVRDSICIDGDSLSTDDYDRISQHVHKLSDENSIGASPFELLTAAALYAFEEARVDVVVLEVGMGGRFDATNVLRDEHILISVITAVDLDHQAYLGSTVREIALEKSGIIRHGRLIALGDQAPENELDVLSSVGWAASQKCATLIRATPTIGDDAACSTAFDSWVTLPSMDPSINASYPTQLALLGAHQRANARLAHAVLNALHTSHPKLFGHLNDSHLKAGFEHAQWPGRLSWHKVPISFPGKETRTLRLLVDGAHNAASASALASYLCTLPDTGCGSSSTAIPPQQNPAACRSSYTFILALSHSPPKTPLSVLSPLLRPGDRVAIAKFVEPIEGMPWVKNVPTEDLLKDARECVGDDSVWYPPASTDNVDRRPGDDLREALRWASEQADVAVLAGSLYLVGDLYRYCNPENE